MSDEEKYESILFCDIPFYIRKDNFGDLYTFRENINGKQYKNVSLKLNDVVLDIGGHIGTFAVPIANKVKQIISVEMDAENFKVLESNTRFYKNISIIEAAVVSNSNEDSTVIYYKAKKNSGANSMYVSRGRGDPLFSPSIKIGELLEKYKPSVIKCDAEGAEYDIFKGLFIPSFVKQIIVEFHFGHKNWRDAANELTKEFIHQGFLCSDSSDMTKNKNWTRVIYFGRS